MRASTLLSSPFSSSFSGGVCSFLSPFFLLSSPRWAVRRHRPVGRARMKETLLVGRRQRTKTVLLPPYVAPKELRVFFRVDYATCLRTCGVRTPEPHRYLWRDETGERQFECVNKSKVLVPFASAAHACKLFGLHPVLVDPEPDWSPSTFSSSSSVSSSSVSSSSASSSSASSSSVSSSSSASSVPSPLPSTKVVVLLGHINHGKTTLLDRLAGTLVAPFEAGGITQNLSAVTVRIPPAISRTPRASPSSSSPPASSSLEAGEPWAQLTFIDTPGHATFAAMRGRASACADLACIVVDVTEGQRLQTDEVLRLADEFDLPLLIVINKVDRILPACASREIALDAGQAEDGETERENSAFADAKEVQLVKMELRRQCQHLREQGLLKRDLDQEIMDAVCTSALYGYGVETLLSRLVLLASSSPPPRPLSPLSLSPGAAALHAKQKRRSDALVEAQVSPAAVGVVLEVGKSSDRGVLYTVLIKQGHFSVGA
ncbi:elongation factor Tu GTP binding domain-containing protein, partial [Toxoplasma gondii CAST]